MWDRFLGPDALAAVGSAFYPDDLSHIDYCWDFVWGAEHCFPYGSVSGT